MVRTEEAPAEPRPATHLAPPDRVGAAELERTIRAAAESPLIDALLHCFGGATAVLNAQRQVLAVNERYLALAGYRDARQALGLRPGETLRCAYATDHPAGCGTGRYCITCGAALAILGAQQANAPHELECALVTARQGVRQELALLARATPVRLAEQPLLLLTLKDISAEKRRAALERTFLHDVSNVVAGLAGSVGFLEGTAIEPEALAEIRALAEQLRREIELQRILLGPEPHSGALAADPVAVVEILEELRHLVRRHPAAEKRELRWPMVSPTEELSTDRTALQRVLLNMLLNALEATDDGDAVHVLVEHSADAVVFRVWNRAAIPAPVALRVFQRYFSTKPGQGRGQGTYSMKLLGESYLGGTVSFASTAREGTSFAIKLPRSAASASVG